MAELPTQIPFADVKRALTDLGLPIDHTLSVTFGVGKVTIEQIRVAPDGRMIAAGNELATITTVIGYTREDES